MISRRTTTLLAEILEDSLDHRRWRKFEDQWSHESLYEFLYDREVFAWLCDSIRTRAKAGKLKDFIRGLHTAASVSTDGATLEKRLATGQTFLRMLCETALAHGVSGGLVGKESDLEPLRRALELDGYAFQNGRLAKSEGEAKEAEEERGELLSLYVSLGLPRQTVVQSCLEGSEKAYATSNWRACVSETRNVLEAILEDVAKAWSASMGSAPPLLNVAPPTPAAGPCRAYLKAHAFLSADETEALKVLHGLLSGAGSHPSMTEAEQARVFRRLALTLGLFLLLRYQAKKAPAVT